MRFTFTGRKIELTQSLKDTTEKKLQKLSKFFSDDAQAQVTYSVQKERQTVEVTIYHGGMIYRAEETSSDMYAAIDRVADVIERQIRRNKTRLAKKLRTGAFEVGSVPEESMDEEREFDIVRTKKHSAKPMSAEEAILQMNLLGHEFYIFKNSETDKSSVVYKRRDGNYGLIEIE